MATKKNIAPLGQAVLAAWLCFSAPLVGQPSAPASNAAGDASWRSGLLAWRAQRERDLAAPDGWLALIGLEWLKAGSNLIGTGGDCQVKLNAKAPEHLAVVTVNGNAVQLAAPSGGFPAGTTIDGAPAHDGPLTVSDAKPSVVAWHGINLIVLDRGGRFALRIKDADAPSRTARQPLHWYAPDWRYRIRAEWSPFADPMVQKIPTVIGTTLTLPSPGFVTFTIDGNKYRLQPVIEPGETDKLFFILRDTTSETTTYGAGRFLHTGLPTHGLDKPGYLVLDFNELYNPPCAYTPYATCPLPPEQNRLAVPLPAGEQRYMH